MAEIDNGVTANVEDGTEVLPEEEIRACLFSIGEETYAIPVEVLTEIIIPQKIFPVPTTPPHVLGVINLRGTIVPVVDIRSVLSLPKRSATGQIAVIKNDTITIGIVVDTVSEVMVVPKSSVLAIPTEYGTQVSKSRSRFFKGIIQRENSLAALLNIERIFEEIALT